MLSYEQYVKLEVMLSAGIAVCLMNNDLELAKVLSVEIICTRDHRKTECAEYHEVLYAILNKYLNEFGIFVENISGSISISKNPRFN